MIASGINTQIHQGELVAVVGVNGVGKSTFLRTLSGVQKGLKGSVFLQGKPETAIPPEELARIVSLVLTEQPLSKNLSVEELVALGRQPYTNWIGTVSDNDRKEVYRALDLVGVKNLQFKKCYELSDGQLQKVLIARALAQNTPLMILDEPTSHLDMHHKAQVLKLLKNLTGKTGKSVMFATHEINLALQLCDKIILMKKGAIRQGTPKELIDSNEFDNLFPSDLIIFDRLSSSFIIKT